MYLLPGKRTYLFALVVVLLMLSSFHHPEDAAQDMFSKVTSSIAIGNASEVVNYCYSSVELETPGSKGIFSQSQAEQILRRFFDKHPPTRFELRHQGYSSTGSKFAVGNYTDTGDETFRVSIFAKKNEGIYQIHELRFE